MSMRRHRTDRGDGGALGGVACGGARTRVCARWNESVHNVWRESARYPVVPNRYTMHMAMRRAPAAAAPLRWSAPG